MLLDWRYFPPSGPLLGLVDAIYVIRGGPAPVASPAGALLPQMHWRLAGDVAWSFDGGPARPIPPAALVGPSATAQVLHARGAFRLAGVGLFPEGWTKLVGEAAHRLTAQMVDLSAVIGAPALLPLCEGPDSRDEEIAAAIESLLLRLLLRGERRRHDARVGVMSAWANGERHDIDALARALDVSNRQLERLSLAACGVSPKLLASKHRTLRLATMMAEGTPPRELWPDAYADQSHFIRHFRRFVGLTPGEFAGPVQTLARDVFGARAAIRSPHALGLYTGTETGADPVARR